MAKLVLMILVALLALGQTARFEVVSVKAAAARRLESGLGLHRTGFQVTRDPERITYSAVTLMQLLREAYAIEPNQITSPDWMDNLEYDIVAKLPSGAAPTQVPEMLQNMLADRFRVEVHWDSKSQKIYALTTDKSGPKLIKSAAEEPSVSFSGEGRVSLTSYTVADFALFLTKFLDRPVQDRTGITGRYDISVAIDMSRLNQQMPGDPALESTFTSVKELGLKLENRTSEVKHLFVDHAEKAPTQN